MRSLQSLIDECAQLCGGQNALARRIGSSPGRVSNWKSGNVPIPPPMLAKLCDLLELDGDEARALLAHCETENPKHHSAREVMRRAFFGCVLAGVVVSSTLAVAPDDAISVAGYVSEYTLWLVGAAVALAAGTAAFGARRMRNRPPPT